VTSPSTSLKKIQVLLLRSNLTTVSPAIDNSEPIEQQLRIEPRIVTTVAGAVFGQMVTIAQKHRPDVILLDGAFGDPADLVSELDEAMHATPVIVLLDESQRDRGHACVVAGARGCFYHPIDAAALAATILKVHERASRRRLQHADGPGNGRAAGRLIAVRGAKGGVGTSVIAANLAIAIRKLTRQPTALVDGHFYGGDVSVTLNLKADRSVIDLMRHLNDLDEDMLRSTLVEHPSGITVLAAPPEFEEAEAIRADEYQQVLDALCAHYAYVVVDCSPSVDQNSLTALDMAHVVLLVSTPEIAALKNAARVLQLGARLGYSEQKMRLVLNRFNEPGALAPADFEPHLAHQASFRIPNDGSVLRALTRGEPSVTGRVGKAGKALTQLARIVVDNAGWLGEPKPRGRKLAALRLFRRANPEPSLMVHAAVEAA
jgi:pilus assembly protein CpaE